LPAHQVQISLSHIQAPEYLCTVVTLQCKSSQFSDDFSLIDCGCEHQDPRLKTSD